jgi:hypothetical protein
MWIVVRVMVVVVVLGVERAAYLVASAVWHAEEAGAEARARRVRHLAPPEELPLCPTRGGLCAVRVASPVPKSKGIIPDIN